MDDGAVWSERDTAAEEIRHKEHTATSVAMATEEEEEKEAGHVTALTNQISVSESLEGVQSLSVSSLLTQPEGECV